MALTFVDTHNMIAFLTKLDASEGFDQIKDFLNASTIQYALTVNPNIYVSVIKQFCSSVACMSAKRTSWNEFSLSMASAVICLSTETALFEGMIVAQQAGEGAAEVNVDDVPVVGVANEGAANVHIDDVPVADRVKKLERRNKLRVSKLRRLKKVGTAQRVDTSNDTVMDDVSKQREIIANIDADEDVALKDVAVVEKTAEIEKNADVQGRPADATITIVATAVPTLTTAPSAIRKRKGVVIRDPEETATPSTIIHTKPKSKNKGKGIMVHEPKPLKKKTQIEQDEAYARELEAKLNKNIDWDDVIKQVQRKDKKDNAVMSSNVAFLEKTKEQMEEEDRKALKRISESQEDKAAKKQKLDEEVEELRKHLQIVPNDDDDVYTKATPLALKVPVIDYEIYTDNNKPYYKIKRADGSHQLYLSFLACLDILTEKTWRCTSSNMEKSNKCSWFSKGQKLKTVRVMWCADYNIHYNTVDLAGREKISVNKTSKIYAKGLRLLVKDLLLPSQVDDVG
nr:hypothetical protein [Tanacetum cinerariifolium]